MDGLGTKRCPHCGEAKRIDTFRRRRVSGRQSWCMACVKEYQRGRPRVLLAKRLVRESKQNRTCVDCGIHYPHYVLDYDHRPDEEKKANVSILVKRGAARDIILAEIAKCDLVCANCHRKRTYQRKMEHLGSISDDLLP